jgi:hypothetical protein
MNVKTLKIRKNILNPKLSFQNKNKGNVEGKKGAEFSTFVGKCS